METKKPPATDSELFKRMGVSFVKVEAEDGSVKYEPRYSYRIKAEEAKKELLSRHQKKEHLTLRRHPGDTAKTAFWSYNIELWITGWNDSRGRYHWPYWVYIVPTLLFIGIGVLIGKNLNGFLSILIFLTFISFGWGMGWILHLAYTRHRNFDITEIAIDGMKDIVAAVPKEMDIDKRYVEIQPEIGTPLAVTHFPVPEDFMENVLIIGGIPTKSRKGKPGALIHNHVYNICIGQGIAGRKYSNANFIQGIPTVNIIPRRKESVMEAFTQMVRTSPKRSLTPEQIVEATELVDSVYADIGSITAKADQLKNMLGEEMIRIDTDDDHIYLWALQDIFSDETMRKLDRFLASGGITDPAVLDTISDAKKMKMYASDMHMIQQELKGPSIQMGYGMAVGSTASDEDSWVESNLREKRLHNEEVAKGIEAEKKKQNNGIEDIYQQYQQENEE